MSAKQSETRILKRCNFIPPQAFIQQLYYKYFILLLDKRTIFDASADRSEAHMLMKGCIKNCSIVKLHNKVQIINNEGMHIEQLPQRLKINVF